jgi:hypothetical protein
VPSPDPEATAPLGARVLEIGTGSLFARAFPDETTYVHVGFRHTFEPGRDREFLSLARWPAVWRMLRSGAFDLVAISPTRQSPWSPARILRLLFNRHTLHGDFAAPRAFGQMLPLVAGRTPLVVLDCDDSPILSSHHLMLLRRAALYFKRELPVDHWRLFTGRVLAGIPSRHFRENAARQAMLARLRPISLGLTGRRMLDHVPAPREKKVDVFFRGLVAGRSSHRHDALAEVRALADAGFTVDVSDESMPLEAFMARMAEARLVWSPEGLGWDCFRHYEAAAAWSVPLINLPFIERYAPQEHGIHAVFYDPSGGDLTRQVKAALAAPARLEAMAAAARRHVEAHHTPEAICRYVLAETRRTVAAMPKPQT